jgi:hypothetical protein
VIKGRRKEKKGINGRDISGRQQKLLKILPHLRPEKRIRK